MPEDWEGQGLTEDHFLGGRVRVVQPAAGFRSGIEPVLLAAAVPARPGERVLEGGTGTGVGLLCLAARVPELTGVGVERDPGLAALAVRNIGDSGRANLAVQVLDLGEAGDLGSFDHAFANPPYHPVEGTRSPSAAREDAKRMHPGLLDAWICVLGSGLRYRGTMTVILPVGCVPEVLAAMTRWDCQARSILPLWPRGGRPARLVLIQGVKQGRSPLALLPGLTLHAADAGYTAEAEAILRHGQPLGMRDGRR